MHWERFFYPCKAMSVMSNVRRPSYIALQLNPSFNIPVIAVYMYTGKQFVTNAIRLPKIKLIIIDDVLKLVDKLSSNHSQELNGWFPANWSALMDESDEILKQGRALTRLGPYAYVIYKQDKDGFNSNLTRIKHHFRKHYI